ncbi:Zn-dependent exopeptidase [Yamadazyma tenuis ATCC 10573]|uniref:Zn-dependent exopeptidase n=2 Tax=Candida tenuis TaxID=2315449 RepID=G3B7A3_CANTC|nr:Zn-dependent exopeptidase [Yamadazyma tenuis ATCC 10573]EGV61609.1 Zn-dependent exopeptidase [Yamadazyma tenuis ATCC 10573]
MEQFEIDDFDYDASPHKEGFLKRASFFTKKFATAFSNRVIDPVTNLIDPIYEGLSFVNSQYERSILKIGNPLVVKRLVYVAFMVAVFYLVTRQTVNESINGTSGGAFSSGKFYDIDKLSNIIEDHIDPKSMKEHLEYFSSMPHVAGTSGDLALSKYIETFMKNNGIQKIQNVELRSYLNYPAASKAKTIVKVSDGSFEATLNEMDIMEMEYIGFNPNALNTDTEVEGHMVYANYGTEKDFNDLADANVVLKDSILLIKYGGSLPEANKIELAKKKQVKAILFISHKFTTGKDDDKQDIDTVIERHNVGNGRYSTGDVLTPGWASEDGYVSRLLWFKSESTPKLPTIPLSYKDGQELLSRLGNTGFKFEHDIYSGDKTDDVSKRIKVRIGNNHKDTHQIWNVVGSILGREQNEKSVIIGSARDSSCFGTMSSNSGSVVMLELIKLFTTMQRKFNWTPARTITFVSFDATNYNLAGSTEWIEDRKKTLQEQGYTYIDLSDAVAGDDLTIKANPFLHDIIKECLKSVGSSTIQARGNKKLQHKDKSLSLHELFKLKNKGSDRISNNMIEEKNYVPFINLLNVPSVEIKFEGYSYPKHSCYDNFEHFEKSKIDPSMKKHSQLVELLAKLILNLAEQAVIPFKFGEFVDRLNEYQGDLEKYINEAIRTDGKANEPVMHFEKLTKSFNTLRESANLFDEWTDSWKKFIVQSAEMEPSILAMKRWRWNDCLVEFNEQFISKDMQHPRPGYLNLLFGIPYNAPPTDNGHYQWNTFPAVRDYVDQKDWGRAQFEIDRLANIMELAATQFAAY